MTLGQLLGVALEVLDAVRFPHSLGILYTMVTQFLGFSKYGDEGKVMGLAALGEPVYVDRLGQIIRLLEEGQPLVECFGTEGGTCSIEARCRLKTRLRSAEAAFLADLDRSTLADIALTPLAKTAGNLVVPQ